MNKTIPKLTIKQKKTLEAIEYFIEKYKYSPTYREIAKLLNIDVSQVFKSVMLLEEKGYVSTKNGKARSIIILRGDYD